MKDRLLLLNQVGMEGWRQFRAGILEWKASHLPKLSRLTASGLRKEVEGLIKVGRIPFPDSPYMEDLVQRRLTFLEASSQPIILASFGRSQQVHHGYINSQSEIRINPIWGGFQMDDPDLYKVGLQQLVKIRDYYGKVNFDELVINAALWTAAQYFGSTGGEKDKSSAINAHRVAIAGKKGIRDLRDSGLSLCISEAAVAQEFLSFCGVESTLVFGDMEIEGEQKDPTELHAYNLVKIKDKTYLVDIAEPVIGENRDTGSNVFIKPAVYEISQEQMEKLLSGGTVQVLHTDKKIEGGVLTDVQSKRTYHGPIESPI